MKYNRSLPVLFALALFAGPQPLVRAQVLVDLGSAASFGVLGGSTVTNTGSTVVDGDLGVSPGISVTGFPPGTVSGTIHAGDPTASAAQLAALGVYDVLAGESWTQDFTGVDLGTQTLGPGVYHFDTAAQLTGTLTLDAGNDPNARFDFQIGTTLTTALDSQILLINDATGGDVFWQVGTAATIGVDSLFVGNVLANDSITANAGSAVDGRLWALNGAVTLDTNIINVPASVVPEPASVAVLIAGFVALVVCGRRRRRHA